MSSGSCNNRRRSFSEETNSFCFSEAGATLWVERFGSACLPCSNGMCWPRGRWHLVFISISLVGTESELISESGALKSTHEDESCSLGHSVVLNRGVCLSPPVLQ